MASGSILLDSSILVALFRGDLALRRRVAEQKALMICVTVLGELLNGAFRSPKPAEGERRITDFTEQCGMLVVDEQTAWHDARIRAELAAKGKPIPENHIWIASSAVQHGLTLAARDQHFAWIDGLSLEQW